MEAKTDIKSLLNEVDEALEEERNAAILLLESDIEGLVAKDLAGGLITEEQSRKKHRLEFDEMLRSHKSNEALVEAFDLIAQYFPAVLSAEEQEKYAKDYDACLSRVEEMDVAKVDLEKETLQKIFNISEYLLYCFHRVAFFLYQKGELQAARSVYVLLQTLNPNRAEYFVSLAILCDELGELEEAIRYAGLSVNLEQENPRNYLLLAKLYIKNGENTLAMEEISKAEQFLTGNSPYCEEKEQMKNAVKPHE